MVCTVCHGSGVMPLTHSPSRTFRRFMARTISFRLPCQACDGTGHRPDPVSHPPPPPDRKQQLLEKRREILQTLEEAESVPLSAYFNRTAAEEATAQLEELLRNWDGSPGATETGITWRCLGDALCKQCVSAPLTSPFIPAGPFAPVLETDPRLTRAFEAYRKAETFLPAADAPAERGRLFLSFADALRRLGQEPAIRDEAVRHYRQALLLIPESCTEEAQRIDSALDAIKNSTLLGSGSRRTTLAPYRLPAFHSRVIPTLFPEPGLFGSLSRRESASPVPTGRSSSADDVPVETEQQLRRKAFRVIQDALGTGEIGMEEAAANRQALEDLFAAADQPVSSREEAAEQASRMREVVSTRKHIFTRQGPEPARTPKGTASPAKLAHRAESLLELLEPLKNYLAGELNRVKQGRQENELGLKLLEDLSRAMQSLRKAADNGEARRIEHYQLRSLAQTIRNYGLRNHIMVAQPFWGASHVEPDPTSVFFAGGGRIEADLLRFCNKRDLQLKTAADSAGTGHLRWSLTRESVVGVYDLTGKSQRERASVCHALGVGLARGIYPVVIAQEGAALPFDIDVDTLYLRPPAFDTSSIAKRLDQALFGLHLPSGERSIRATATHLPGGRTCSDPVELERQLKHDLSGDSALLQPVWPPLYPDSSEKSCFHIMPFGQPWSAQVRDKVRRGVERGGLRYSRGDQAKKTHIVRAIWDEICRSSGVIADLTGLNENVCLELGLAQAVGRPVLLMSQDKSGTRMFPEIAKIQVRRYSPGGADLRRLIGAWLTDL
jgi:hypothetical protein